MATVVQKPRLELRQTVGQNLTLTPQLQQAIKLLQLSNIELQSVIDEALEENPILERVEEDVAEKGGVDEMSSGEAMHTEIQDISENGEPQALDFASPDTKANDLDVSQEDVWQDYTDDASFGRQPESFGESADSMDNLSLDGGLHSKPSTRSSLADGEETSWENRLLSRLTLRDHILSQIHMNFESLEEQKVAELLLGGLDESGYFRGDLKKVSEELHIELSTVQEIFRALQDSEPAGIFATSLSECLYLQLKDQGLLDTGIKKILENLDLLGTRDIVRLAKVTDLTPEEISQKMSIIRSLDPKPGLQFDSPRIQTIIPDLHVWRDRGGIWQVDLNTETLPKIFINQDYYQHIKNAAKARNDKKYLQERYQSATWLIRSLEQRATTLLRVAQEIVLQQENFFDYGIRYLRPMVLRNVAINLNLHESTVSRVTTNKYMNTPRGLYELKFFFTSALGAAAPGQAGLSHLVSGESVRHRLQEFVTTENGANPLSDEALVTLFEKEGIHVARRTIAKYRDILKIPSSTQRRRQNRAGF